MSNNKLRSVDTYFWQDRWVSDIDPIEKLLFLYLLTNDNTNMLGIYEIHHRKIAFDTGIDGDMVLKILKRFQQHGKVSYEEGFIVIHNFLAHQRMNENMKKSAVTTYKSLPERIRDHEVTFKIRKELIGISENISTLVVSLNRREALFVKYRCICQYCDTEIKSNTDLEIDHVHPLSKGGPDTYENLTLSCTSCNRAKLDKDIEEIGFKKPSTGPYHYNIARKDLLEIKWLRDKFNKVFERQVVVSDGVLIDVNHKHTFNNDKQMLPKEEVEIETEIETEIEVEEESENESDLISSSTSDLTLMSKDKYDNTLAEIICSTMGNEYLEQIISKNKSIDTFFKIVEARGLKSFLDWTNYVAKNDLEMEYLQNQLKVKPDRIKKELKEFYSYHKGQPKLYTKKDFRNHFINWSRKRV